MPDPFRLLNPGDSLGPGDGPFNSQWHNAVTESVRVTQRNTAPGVTAKSIDTDKGGERWYANISEANVDQFVAVGLGDLAIPPDTNGEFRERVVFYTADLAADEPFGITQEPVGAGELFICKTNTGPGGQPPSADWVRMLGDVAAYNGSTDYTVGMRVSQAGSDYVCIAATTGNAPPNASYWVLEGTHQGPWMLADSYVAGDVIVVPPMGRLKVSGDSPVWLDVTDAAHKRAGVVAGVLESTTDGPLLILSREGGTGEQWAVVRFDDAGGVASFKTIAVSGQSNVVADSATDTLTLAAGANITLTTDATTDTVTIAATGVITSVNGENGPAITHDVGTSGTDHNISASGDTITHNIPNASLTARGVVTTTTQTIGGVKTFNDLVIASDGIDTADVYFPGIEKTIYFGGSGLTSPDGTLPLISAALVTGSAGLIPRPTSLSTGPLNLADCAYCVWITSAGPESPTLMPGLVSQCFGAYDYFSLNGGGWVSGSHGVDAIGNIFVGGICVSPRTSTLTVSVGGTGATSFTSGSLIVGAGTGALSSVATTRVSGGNLQLKLASDSWIEFGEASY